jgi:ubiquinone/menaquinone biosynthesis C-methylase UbiE
MKVSLRIRILSITALVAPKVWKVSAFQPDGKPSVYKTTVERIQEDLVIAPTTIVQESSSSIPLVDEGPPNYWFHPQIHTFGNAGPLGALHASVAPLATKLIDVAAYEGENVRDQVARELSTALPFSARKSMNKHDVLLQKPKIVDLACGVGMSTRALQKAFPHASQLVGIDTSGQMIRMAKALSNPKSVQSKTVQVLSDLLFRLNDVKPKSDDFQAACSIDYNQANAEDTGLEGGSFDLATIMYCFHEAPYWGRSRILKEAHRLLAPGATLAILDISPKYEPSFTMLAGEPYVLEYQQNIRLQLNQAHGFHNCRYREVVEGHVGLWLLDKEEE